MGLPVVVSGRVVSDMVGLDTFKHVSDNCYAALPDDPERDVFKLPEFMSVMVEKRFGRDVLIETMLDLRKLLVLYNRAAEEQNAGGGDTLPLWPEEMLQHIDAE